jgi:hypothetical protein
MSEFMVKIVKGTETNKWLPPNWRKSTFPVFNQPAKTSEDIRGSAFLLQYENKPYMVTANHVIETENPVIVFSTKNKQTIGVSFSAFQKAGLSWVKHPAGLDLAAVPFLLPMSLVEQLDLWLITEDKWTPQDTVKLGDRVAHLGYPERGTSNYSDGSPSPFPQAMPGKIIQLNLPYIVMETAGAHGASGGPAFLRRRNKSPFLISVVTDAVMLGRATRPMEAEYSNKTKSLVASLVKDILESEKMGAQFGRFGERLIRRYLEIGN